MSIRLATGTGTFGRWVAAITIGLLHGLSPDVSWAQTGPAPPCRVARLDEEQNLIASAQRSLAQLNEISALLRTQADNAEVRLRDPGAPPALAETFRRLRSQLRDLEDQRNQVILLLAGWCEPSRQPQR